MLESDIVTACEGVSESCSLTVTVPKVVEKDWLASSSEVEADQNPDSLGDGLKVIIVCASS